jgi:tetratricopeptide (TPR) repeat protein
MFPLEPYRIPRPRQAARALVTEVEQMHRSIVLLGLSFLLLPCVGSSQDAPTSVGTRVVTKYGTALKTDQGVVDEGKTFRVYTVDRKDGDRLWVVSGSKAGWVRASEAIPFNRAIEFYTDEIKREPTSLSYQMRGNVWREQKDHDRAIDDYNKAIRISPWDAKAHFYRADAWMDKQDAEKALDDLNEAILLDHTQAEAFDARGSVWMQKGRIERALTDYNEAIRLEPEYAIGICDRGSVWLTRKDYDRAIADYNQAIRLDPKLTMAFENRGHAWLDKKEFAKALADFEESIRLEPSDAFPYAIRAWIWSTCPDAKLRDGKKAVESAARACELSEWKAAYCIESLAAAYAESGDFDKASQLQDDANRLHPEGIAREYGRGRLILYRRDKKPYRDNN